MPAKPVLALLLPCLPLTAQNNECASAVPLGLGINGPFTNAGSSTSAPGWPCGLGGTDVWFRFTASVAGLHTFRTCTSTRNFDTLLQVFGGNCAALVSLGCNDDACGLGSQVQVQLSAGTTYLVRVGGYASETGLFDLLVSIGAGNGAIVAEIPSGCGIAQVTITGWPNLGGTLSASMTGHSGLPALGFGFQRLPQVFCNCTIGTEWSFVVPGTTWSQGIPVNTALVGVQFFMQGAEIGTTAGCQMVPFAVTDTWRVTIG